MMAEEPEPRPAITKVWARNFRSIEYAELELDPLTMLVGPNASGKSNLLDIIGFLSDAVRDGLETAISRRGGIDSVGRRAANGRVLGPELGMSFRFSGNLGFLKGTLDYRLKFSKVSGGEYSINRESAKVNPSFPDTGTVDVALSDRRLTKPWVANLHASPPKTPGRSKKQNPLAAPDWLAEELSEGFNDQALQLLTDRPRGLNHPLFVLELSAPRESRRTYMTLTSFLQAACEMLAGCHLYHLFPNSLREPQKTADSHPLTANADNLASALRDMIQKENRFLPDLKHALNYAVPGITDIRVSRAGSFQVVELKHEREGGKSRGSWFDLSYESDGTIRLLAMLTALFQEPALPLIGLEEPELAIHPGAMAVLAENMVEASLRGQVVVATHSPDLIDRMPIESIRAVSAESGSTKVGRVASHQLKSVRQGLFSAGEIHSMQGLQPAEVED